ncbi:MAG: hypothetical protein Kow0025_02560 [Thermodesulfovibrionales bacterium]
MKRMMKWAAVALLVLAVAAVSFAETRQVAGEVVSIDTEGRTVTVLAADGETAVDYNDGTAITAGEEALKATDIIPGDKVTVTVREEGGKLVADRIDISLEN